MKIQKLGKFWSLFANKMSHHNEKALEYTVNLLCAMKKKKQWVIAMNLLRKEVTEDY